MKYKVVVTKGIFEVTTYQKLNTKAPISDAWKGEGIQREENYRNTQRARRTAIRQLVATNFQSSDLFITLTFNNSQNIDINNPKETNKLFNKFIKRFKYKYPNIKGLAVIEFQDANGRGAVHYHVILNGVKYISNKELNEIWSYGYVKVNAIDKVDNVGAYVVKYMNKDLDDKRLMGCKAYLQFGKLDKPLVLKSWNKQDNQRMQEVEYLLKEKAPIYSHKYQSDKAGLITYNQFNLNRKPQKNKE